MDITQLISQDDSLRRYGMLAERCPDGALRANVPHVRYHSPSGYECGYAGSGPADLALSVLHALLPPPSEAEELAQYDLTGDAFNKALEDPARWSEKVGPDKMRVSNLALRLHQAFKFEFIANMDKDGGHIPIGDIENWIARRRVALEERS